jgi:hypothetical protein
MSDSVPLKVRYINKLAGVTFGKAGKKNPQVLGFDTPLQTVFILCYFILFLLSLFLLSAASMLSIETRRYTSIIVVFIILKTVWTDFVRCIWWRGWL